MIGSLWNTVVDCPDPQALAAFYSAVLGWPVARDDGDWVTLDSPGGRPGIAFQQAPDHRPPDWPDPGRPQQFHLDIKIAAEAGIDAAEQAVLALGAQRLPGGGGDGEDFRVYADPAGHPFCLVWS